METPDHLLREQITAAYAPLVALYQLFESRLRETPDDVPPVGWKPQLEALRALRDGEVTGDPVALGRLLTDPAALSPVPDLDDPVRAAIGTPHALVIRPYDPRTVSAIAEPLIAADRRILLLAPTPESAQTALRALTPLTETPRPTDAPGPTRTSDSTASLTSSNSPSPTDGPGTTRTSNSTPSLTSTDTQGPTEGSGPSDSPGPTSTSDSTASLTSTDTPGPTDSPDTTSTSASTPSLASIDTPSPTDAQGPTEGSGPTSTSNSTASLTSTDTPGPTDSSGTTSNSDSTPSLTSTDSSSPTGRTRTSDSTLASIDSSASADSSGSAHHSGSTGSPGSADSPGPTDSSRMTDSPDLAHTSGLSHGPGLAGGVGSMGAEWPLVLVSEPDGAEAETLVRTSRLVPFGEAMVASWQAERKRLQRELLWLEQWPRDVVWLAGLQTEREEHLKRLVAEGERLVDEVARLRDEAATAELEAVAARAARAETAVELARAEGIEAGLREEYEGFAAIADAASQVSAERSSAAEEAYDRYRAMQERYTAAEAELAQARDREAYLLHELPRARAAMPAAERAVEVAEQAVTAAEAEGHASYYRLAATESALAADKKTLNLGQRLRIVPAKESTQALRQELVEKRREADGSAERIRRARAEHERAQSYLAAVADIISSGDKELTTVRERQQRLVAELNRLAADRDPARIEHESRARDAAVALDEATEKGTTARLAEARLQQGVQRLDAARANDEEAASVVEEAEERAQRGFAAVAEAEAELERHHAEHATALRHPSAELTDAVEAEAGSRHHVAELCGGDPTVEGADRLASLRDEAMARIEELAGLLEATDQEALLARASIVCVTPGSLAADPVLHGAEFDTLVAVDAGRLTDGELLLAAIHTRHWILLGDSDQTPPPPNAEFAAFLEALAELSAFTEESAEATYPDASVTIPDLDPVPHPPGPDDRLSPEANRLRTSGLWESRYREAYTKALARLHRADPDVDAQRLLLSTLTDHLRSSAFHRALVTAPDLVSTIPEDVPPTPDPWLPLDS